MQTLVQQQSWIKQHSKEKLKIEEMESEREREHQKLRLSCPKKSNAAFCNAALVLFHAPRPALRPSSHHIRVCHNVLQSLHSLGRRQPHFSET